MNFIKHKVTKASDFAEVWQCSLIDDKSLKATVSFATGDIISTFGAKERLPEPNYLTLQLNEQEHIMVAPDFLQYVNLHSALVKCGLRILGNG